MSDKTSQRTEEEMLDQTFVGYDDEMTVQTEDGAKDAATAAAPATENKKKNQNLLIYGVMGVAAVGIIGFKFLSGSSTPAPQQEPVQQPAPQNASAPAQVASAPVVAATTEPVPVPSNASAPVGVPTPEVSASAPVTAPASSPVVDPVAQFTGNTNSASLPQVEVKPEVKPAVPEVKPEVKPAVKPEVKVEAVPAVVASNAEASSNNDKLIAQFQKMLEDKYDPKFQKIEKSLDEQKDFNKSIEERLSRLEAGKTTKSVAVKSDATSVSSDSSEVKATEKPVKKIVRKPIVKHSEVNSKFVSTKTNKSVGSKVEDGEVLIDRSSIKSKPEVQKIEPVYPKVEIHSIYSGRVWTKNADGTLSTFAVGDKLPTGEVIKKIDEEKEKITTDKRVISE